MAGMSRTIDLSRKPPRSAGELAGSVSFRRGLATPYTLGLVALAGGLGASVPALLSGFSTAAPGTVAPLLAGGFFLLLGVAFIYSAERIARGRRKGFEQGVLVTGTIAGFGTRRTVFRSARTPTARIRFEPPDGGEKSLETPLFGRLGPDDLPEGTQVIIAWLGEKGRGVPLIPKRRETVLSIRESL
jgi:hypothetical protein